VQGIYNYIRETNHVSRAYSVAAVLYLQFVLHVPCNVISPVKYVLYLYISTLRSMCAVPNMAVVCSSLISCFPGMLLTYCPSDFEMVLVSLLLANSTCAEFIL
jgi:uncharacterized membrane protein YesL